MTKVNLDLPPEVFSARRLSPDDFVRDMRLAAAIYWYQKAEISGGDTEVVAGLKGLLILHCSHVQSTRSLQCDY